MIKPVNCMSMDPLLQLFYCERSSLIRGDAVWNIMTVDRHCMYTSPWMAVLAEALHAGMANLYPG